MEAVDISDLIVKKLGFLYKLCEALKFYAKGIKVALFMSSVIYDQNCARKKETKKETTTTVELCDAFGHKMLYIHFHNVKIY